MIQPDPARALRGGVAEEQDAPLVVAREMIARLQRENEQLQSRLAQLEEQVRMRPRGLRR